jgi:GT2 family glycosyltransferase
VTTPRVSVVVVTYNGREHLDAVFGSLRAQDWPADALELLCVDNGSADGSREHLAAAYPEVRVEALGRNTGFAGGCNAGARAATGELLCFINDDMRAEPGWVRAMVGPLLADPDLGATGGKVLSWDGATVDFAGAVMNFEGRGGQVGFGEPNQPGRHDRGGPMLFANGGSLAIRRDRFLDVGGFDEDFFAYYEDVDLGWRLWLYGHGVRFVPEAVTYHRHHGTSAKLPQGKLRVLYERNALLAAVKNYEAANLGRVLAPAYMLAARRAVADSRVDPAGFDLNRPERVEELVPAPEAVATLVAMDEVNRLLPRALARRAEVQRRRVRSDASLRELVGDPWFAARADPGYVALQASLVELFEVERLYTASRPRVLVVAADPAGPGERTLALCRALAADADVTLAGAGPVVGGFEVVGLDRRGLRGLADAADLVVCRQGALAANPWLARLPAPVAVDLDQPCPPAGPPEAELRAGDFFVCPDERAWATVTGMLHLLGRLTPELYDRDPTLRGFVAVAGDGPDGPDALRRFLAAPRQAPDRPRSSGGPPWRSPGPLRRARFSGGPPRRLPAPAARVAGYWREHGTRRTAAAVGRRLARAARLSRPV